MNSSYPIVVVGAGPAGLWLAALLARRGVSLCVVDPQIDAPWPNTYGVWSDELEGLELDVPAEAEFEQATVHLPDRPPKILRRAYTRIDTKAFRAQLIAELESAGAMLVAGAASGVSQVADDVDRSAPLRLTLEDGRTLDARAIIDATGKGVLYHRGVQPKVPGVQSALGWLARFETDPLQGHPFEMMDFRPAPSANNAGLSTAEVPTFLYGMHLGDDRYFVEETALVTRSPLSFEHLEARLRARLEERGALPIEILEVERCLIPMGGDPPTLSDDEETPVIPFGAAAGFVHPATGYSLARTLRLGAPMADLLADAIERDQPPSALAKRALGLIWTPGGRRARALYSLGQESVLEMDLAQIARFFEAFFELSDEDWQGYMAATLKPGQLAALMWRVFGQAPNPLRVHLAMQALRVAPETLQAMFNSSSNSEDPTP